jgi:hypothetical protein
MNTFSTKPLFVIIAAIFMLSNCDLMSHDNAQSRQRLLDLKEGFVNPPNEARPRVWWHWLNGNITWDGIKKDLDWMQRVGIGGLQNFDVNFAVPIIVEDPIIYMSEVCLS